MFKDDNTVIHFKKPLSTYLFTINIFIFQIVQFSVKENLMVVTGNPETKELKELMPEILKQVGPQQY